MSKTLIGLIFFLLGLVALVFSSYTRTLSTEYIQFTVLIVFFVICGWMISRFYKKLLPYPLLFFFPTIIILLTGFIINKNGWVHYIGESLMIIPGFFIGFFFFRWSKKLQLVAAIIIPIFYFFYLSKINPELHYYSNSVRGNRNRITKGILIPNFQFIKKDSSLMTINDYKGKVILIDFYFNNCLPCLKKMPALARVKKHYKETTDFILLAVHRGGSESFSDFLAKIDNMPKDINYVYDSSSSASKHLRISGYPFEIIIDKQGKIRELLVGYNNDLSLVYEKNTIKKIDALLNEK